MTLFFIIYDEFYLNSYEKIDLYIVLSFSSADNNISVY